MTERLERPVAVVVRKVNVFLLVQKRASVLSALKRVEQCHVGCK